MDKAKGKSKKAKKPFAICCFNSDKQFISYHVNRDFETDEKLPILFNELFTKVSEAPENFKDGNLINRDTYSSPIHIDNKPPDGWNVQIERVCSIDIAEILKKIYAQTQKSLEVAYEKGYKSGKNLLMGLNSGSHTLKDFEKFK